MSWRREAGFSETQQEDLICKAAPLSLFAPVCGTRALHSGVRFIPHPGSLYSAPSPFLLPYLLIPDHFRLLCTCLQCTAFKFLAWSRCLCITHRSFFLSSLILPPPSFDPSPLGDIRVKSLKYRQVCVSGPAVPSTGESPELSSEK